MLLSVSQGDWLASFDLREAYIPVTVPPTSRPFLRFLLRVTVYQFQALCFGLSTAPPVFTWVMAPVSAILHSLGIRMRRYLDTWLVQSSSQESLLEVLLPVLRLCPVFWDCHPSQVFHPHTFPGSAVSVGRLRFHLFQGFSVGGTHLSAAIYNRRIFVMRLAYREPVAVASRRSFFASSPSSGRLAFFLGWLASFLAATWDCSPSSSASIVHGTVPDLEAPILASMECLHGLQWWLHLPRIYLGVSLHQVSPVLHFWSDASDVGWGAHLDCQVASGL